MLISEPQELRLHVPSNAVDEVDNFQGILNTSEKDFLKDKLGADLYDRLCAYYKTLDPVAFAQSVVDGTYSQNPWSELLFYAQSMIVNDAFTRFAYQQVISVNGSGINVVSGNDYGNADDRLLDKGVGGYRKESMKALNNLLVLLEEWSNQLSTPMPIEDEETDGVPTPPSDETTVPDDSPSGIEEVDAHAAIEEIVTLWQKSKYFYRHADLILPTCVILNEYLDIEDYRDRFIRLLPDLHFIQNQYITKAIGVEQLQHLLTLCVQEQNGNLDKYSDDGQYLDTVRYLMVAYLEQRTTVLTIDKARRQQAHDEAISLKENILATLKKREEQPSSGATEAPVPEESSSGKLYQNNAQGSRIFVSPLLY